MKKALKDLLDYEQPTKYIVATENYSDEYKTPVLTAGKSFILGYTDETSGIFSGTKEPVIIFDDFTRDTKYVDFDFKVKSSAMKILHKKNAEDSLRFFHYAIQKIDYKPFNHKRLWISDFSNFEIDYKSPEEQQKIAHHLDTIQSAIDNKKKQLSELDELVKSKFVEMFGENPVENGKWKVEKLGNLCSIGGGYAFKSDKFLEDGIPVLRIGNINAGFLRPTNMVYWENDDKLERYAIYPGDLVMSLTGTAGKEDYGNICVLGDEYPKYFLNQRNAKFTDLKNLNKLYLAHLLKLQDMKQKLTGLNHGVRQGNILNKDLENLEIPVPPIELQNTFAEYVQKIDSAKSIIKTQLNDLNELLESKMDFYFGE